MCGVEIIQHGLHRPLAARARRDQPMGLQPLLGVVALGLQSLKKSLYSVPVDADPFAVEDIGEDRCPELDALGGQNARPCTETSRG